jgi:hypothetical protein
VDDPSAEVIRFFAAEGYGVKVEQRNLHAEHLAHGDGSRASFFAPGVEYFCVSLERDGVVVWPDVAHDRTVEAALASAGRWYRR